MRKITAKYITENLAAMMEGEHIVYRGSEYWLVPDMVGHGRFDPQNGTIYYISEDRKILGSINGYEYGKVINGVAYRV